MKAHRTSSTVVGLTALAVILGGCGSTSEDPEVIPAENSSEQTGGPAGDATDEAGTTQGSGGDSTVTEGEAAGATDTQDDGQDGDDGQAGDDGSDEGSGEGSGDGAPADIPTVPVDYADALVVAWGAGDHATMEQLGTAEVVHILGDGGGPNWEQVDSDGAAGSTSVTYRNTESGDTLALRVDNAAASEGAEQAVVQAKYTVAGDEEDLPTEPAAYADALVVAWGASEQGLVSRMATPEVVHILGDGGGPNWEQTGAEGAAGSTYVTYENSESGDVLTLRVDNATASEGADQAVVEATYETP